ncbi:MAG: hydrogenase maturation nickel metallochaperone HypA [Desulfobacterales bacterium]
MHEMGIALQIIDIAKASIPPEHQGSKIAAVILKVGKLSAVVPDSLRFCFGVASQDTPLAGAELVIHEIPVRGRCKACRHTWTIEGPAFSCPHCEGGDIELTSGRELDIESLELAEE